MGIATLVTIVGILWFQVPFVGNPFVFIFGATVYLLSLLALGLLISTVCSTQRQAFATNFFVLNPFFILSGFSFPISSMPDELQWLTYANPLRYFLVVIRGTFLKGIGHPVAELPGNGRDRGGAFDRQHSPIPEIGGIRRRTDQTEPT